MAEQFFTKELSNGLTLLGQKMPGVSSAALDVLIPSGASRDPEGAEGAASVAAEWCIRGAGGRSTRELNDALDSLGCQHHESVQSEHVQFSALQLGRNLPNVMEVYADIVRRPNLDETAFEPARALTLQDLASLEDEPARKCNMLLREKFYPNPLGGCIYGTRESLRAMTPGTVAEHVRAAFAPKGTIVAAAGEIDWEEFADQAERLFGDWSAPEQPEPSPRPAENGVTHITKDSAQVHIALAHRSVVISHEDYYKARTAAAVLSAGMSSRLFTEVREKRGLVYHVSSRYHALKEHAGVFTYAASRPDLAQQTLEVTAGELRRLCEGVTDEEMARAKVQLKSALVMQGESTSARASSIAGDWYHLRRLRSLEELSGAIDAVTPTDVTEHLRRFPPENFTVLTIGPEPLDTSCVQK